MHHGLDQKDDVPVSVKLPRMQVHKANQVLQRQVPLRVKVQFLKSEVLFLQLRGRESVQELQLEKVKRFGQ